MSAGSGAGDLDRFLPTPPKAVRDAAAAAEAAQRAMKPGQPGPASAEPQDGHQPPDGSHPAAPAPEAAPAPPQATPAPVQGSAPPPADDATWEQRARSALGRLETTSTQLTQALGRIDQLEGLIAGMQATGQSPKPETQAPQPVTLLTPEERDEYGDGMLSVVGKRAREEIAPEIETLRATVSQLQSRLDGVGTVISRQQTRSVYDALAEAVPNWRDINRSPDFVEWSAQVEPYSGVPRAKLITEAFHRHEADRVVRFFQGFLSEAAALDPANLQPGSGTAPAYAAGNGKIPLEAFAAPGRARSAPPTVPPDKPTYSRAAITQFWADKRRGLYKGREAEADQIERDIFLAQHEGRIH
jgi:hypothetical protein